MAKVPLRFPFAGRSDRAAYHRQPELTTRSARNMRGRDPATGRVRGAQRAGQTKFNPVALGAAGTGRALCSAVIDDRKVNYSFTPGAESVLWAKATPQATDAVNAKTDRQGNLYVIDGKSGIVKYNPTGLEVAKLALPSADPDHIVRGLWIDEFDNVYASVSAGGEPTTARIWKYRQVPDNAFEQVWEIEPGGYTEDIVVVKDKLYAAQNFPTENKSRIRVYEFIATTAPEVALSIEDVAFPINGIAAGDDGSIYSASPDNLDPTTLSFRPPHPAFPKGKPTITDFEPTDITDSARRIWAWYRAEDIDATDVHPDDIENGKPKDNARVLRWRDRSGHGRDLFQNSGINVGELFEAPHLQKVGPGGRPSIRFDGDLVTPHQSLTSLPNYSIAKELADQQRSMLPAYTGSMYCLFMLIRPAPDAATNLHLVFGQQAAAGAGFNHALWLNAASGSTIPLTFSANKIFYYAASQGSDPASGTALHSPDYDWTANDKDTGLVLITVLWDGGIDPGAVPTKTRSLVRYNGKPLDRFLGQPFSSLLGTILGRSRSGISAAANPFRGEIVEILVLDRINRFDDVTEPKVLTHDPLEATSPDMDQTDNELTRIEAYFAYRYGIQELLPQAPDTFTHKYEFFSGPPPLGVNGPYRLIPFADALVAKYDDRGKLVWSYNTSFGVSETPANRGGVGYGVAVRRNEDGKNHVYNMGPHGRNAVGVVSARKLIDLGTSVSDAQANGAWRHKLTSNRDLDYSYPRPAVDEFGNMYLPHFETDAAAEFSIKVLKKDPDAMGDAVLLSSFLLSGGLQAHAIALPPLELTPDYRAALATKLKEFAYLATENKGLSSNPTVHKLRFVVTSSLATGTPRAVRNVVAIGGNIKRFDATTITTPTGGAAAFDPAAQYVKCVECRGALVFLDGLSYKVYDLIEDVVSTLEATGAGEIPPRMKLGCFWRHRLVIARSADEPGQWAMSAVGDIKNWDFFPPVFTATQAVKGSFARAAQAPDVIVGLIPATDDLLFFLGERSVRRLTGDPQDGGQIDLLSDSIGGTFGTAHAKDSAGRIFFFGNPPGLYGLTPNEVVPLSRNTIEDTDFASINWQTHRIEMIWNEIDKGVHIFRIPYIQAGTVVDHWFWEEKTSELVRQAPLWPDRFGAGTVQPVAVTFLNGDSTRGLLLLGEDGFVRIWSPTAKNDDGNLIDSFVLLGPLVGQEGPFVEQKLTETKIVLAGDQNGARLELFASEEADDPGPIVQAVDIPPGLSGAFKKRVRGNFLWMRLRNAFLNERWAFESGQFEYFPVSRQRMKTT